MSENRFSLTEAGVFEGWIQLHPQVFRTRPNAKAFGDWLEARSLRITMKTLDDAFAALKSEGRLELAETEEQKIERLRQVIYTDVNQKLAPARIDFSNPVVISKIASWLHANERGFLSTDRCLRAIEALKFEPGIWQVEPLNLFKPQEYVAGRVNHSKLPKQPETQEENRGPVGRRNHALDDAFDKEHKEGFKKIRKGMDEEEGRRIGMVIDHAISGYKAQGPNRIDYVKTEIIQGLLRKYAAKHGADVVRIVRELPDDPSAAEMYLRRRL